MEMVNMIIDGKPVKVPADYTVLEAARYANVDIPTLCYLKGVNEIGACRVCVVEIKGGRSLQAACVYPASEGLEVYTNTPAVREARRVNIELILSNHNRECLSCVRNRNCELQQLADDLNVQKNRFLGENTKVILDTVSPSVVRDNSKCVLCRRCVSACKKMQSVAVIDAANRGFATSIIPPFDMSLSEVPCVNCGQCITACPVGALSEKDNTSEVWSAIADKTKHVVVQAAPAVRAALGEEFGMPIGTCVTGKLAASMRRLGFDGVFDTDFSADLTIMEEGTELLARVLEGKGKLPMITSCSPGWIKFCEHNYPDMLEHLSTCKSPQQMFGAVLKSYYAQKKGIDPKDMIVVSVMPCTAKKFERSREEMEVDGNRDIDIVITTRELAKMIKEAGIDFINLADEHFDDPFGIGSGAGVIFGATGGVMEAALRTVKEIVEGKELEEIEFKAVRGVEGIKEATVKVGDLDVKVAVAHGLVNARAIMDKIKSGEADYHFIEVMACPGGCVTGGGQPIVSAKKQMQINVKEARAKALYTEDTVLSVRKSHKNPAIEIIYNDYLGKPGGHKSHELLHTHYHKRENY